VELLAGHVTEGSARKNFETRGSAISSSNSVAIERASEFFYNINNNNLNSNFYEMGVTLPEYNTSQSSIWLGLDPPVSEFNLNSIYNWSMLDSFESALLKPEVDMDLGDDSLHEYLLDQDVGSITLCDSSWPLVSHRSLYRQMPNFGISKIGQSRPLLHFVGTAMKCKEVEASRTDSPPTQAPGSAPSSLKGASQLPEVLPTTASAPVSEPVKLQLAAGEEQGILLSEPSEEEVSEVLALPWALVAHQYWVSRNTNLRNNEVCGESDNCICHQCRRKFFLHTAAACPCPPTLCECVLTVRGILIPTRLCAAPSAHIALPHGQHVRGC